MGLGEASANAKILDVATEELKAITGQKPVITKAKKSIAAFKLRQGMSIGTMVTLRGDRMYEFLDRLDLGRSAACSRLSRHLGKGIRRPRKLHARYSRAVDLSGDRF